MAESGGNSDVKEDENTSSNFSEENIKFKDPLTSALEKDSDDGEVILVSFFLGQLAFYGA